MSDLKISQLPALSGSDLASADQLAVVDSSASQTSKLTVGDLIANGVTLINDNTIPGAKILFDSGSIATAALADSGVTTVKIAADAITSTKIADNVIVALASTLPTSGGFIGQLALDTDDNSLYVWSGTTWLNTKAPASVNAFTDTTAGIINITTAVSSGTATVTASIDNTASAAQFLAGPVGSGGTVGYRTIDGGDLPTATTSAKGGVIVNGGGLSLSTDTIQIANSVTASSTKHLVTYDANGLITGGSVISSSDLPVATSSARGAVVASDGLVVDASGNLSIDNTVTAGTYTKVTVTSKGVVSAGDVLVAADIPDHSAAKLTSGTIGSSLIANDSITAAKLANEATTKFGGAASSDNVTIFPAGDFKGQFFYDETTQDLYIYTGSAFVPITVLSGNLVNAGAYNANTNQMSSVTSAGSAAGFSVGSALPAPAVTNLNHYVVVDTSGTGSGAAPAVALAPPDMLLSQGVGTEYSLIDVSNAIAGQTASNISLIATGNIVATDVQAGIQELDTEKLPKAGGTMTGDLNLGTSTNVVFEGSSADDYETTLTVTNPTADRTITLPNVTGTVVTTGDTGSVTSTMILDGTINNGDINASAEIAVSKLANGTARQLLQTDAGGSGVEFTSNVDVPGTLDVTSGATFDSTVAVTGLLSANGKLAYPAGSAAAVSLYSGTDTDTGIYSPGSNQFGIATAGTSRIVVDSSGNVLLGTTTNYADGGADNLVVGSTSVGEQGITIGASTSSQIRFADAAANTAGYILYNHSDNALAFGVSSERMRIDSSGNIGIGTSSPATKFVVSNGGAEGLELGHTSGTNEVSSYNRNTSARAPVDIIAQTFKVLTGNPSLNNGLFQDSSGNVGIGTTSPSDTLHLNGATGYGLKVTDSSSHIGVYRTHSDGAILKTASNHALLFGTNDTERMRIDSSGRLLVGNSSTIPINGLDCALQVEGATTATSRISVINRGNNAEGAGIQIAKSRGTIPHNVATDDSVGGIFWCAGDGTDFVSQAAKIECFIDALPGGSDTPGRLVFSTTPDQTDSPVERMRISASGRVIINDTNSESYAEALQVMGDHSGEYALAVKITGSSGHLMRFASSNGVVGSITCSGSSISVNTSSDYRLKENVVNLSAAIPRLKTLPVYRFNFITDSETTVDGFLAHEAQLVVPEAVTGTHNEVDDDGNPVYQGIDQAKLVPLLTAALQEAIGRIETLETKVAALEAG